MKTLHVTSWNEQFAFDDEMKRHPHFVVECRWAMDGNGFEDWNNDKYPKPGEPIVTDLPLGKFIVVSVQSDGTCVAEDAEGYARRMLS